MLFAHTGTYFRRLVKSRLKVCSLSKEKKVRYLLSFPRKMQLDPMQSQPNSPTQQYLPTTAKLRSCKERC
ncbi:hypothetical protein FF1_042916 [Malus domestica]